MLNRLILLVTLLLFLGINQSFSQSDITLEDIWSKFTFITKSTPGFNFSNDGEHYSLLQDNSIEEYHIADGKKTKTILKGESIKNKANFLGSLAGYTFDKQEEKILLESETESIYRRSTRSRYHVYHRSSGAVQEVYSQGKIMYATFSPDGTKVGFVYNNNLYYKDLTTDLITQITFDGQKNKIINGGADWVYEEEFVMSRAFEWSPDSRKIAFLKFDESNVPEFTLTMYKEGLYPEYETFKYPKVGEKNSSVTAHVFNVENGENLFFQKDHPREVYIPRIDWSPNSESLMITTLNRHQNHLKLYEFDTKKKDARVILEEKDDRYVDLHDNLTFIDKGKSFIWTSEKSGFNHIYLVNAKNGQWTDLTPYDYDITSFYGYDPITQNLYYQAASINPMQREIYSIDKKGRKRDQISTSAGWNEAIFSKNFGYYVINHSTINRAPIYTLYNRAGQSVRVIENNDHLETLQQSRETQDAEFFTLKTSEQIELNGWMIRPGDFSVDKRYPVLMFVYGGPGSQQVTDRWKGNNYWWFQHLAQQGYIVACIDNRGTGARGSDFKKVTYQQLGHYETIDQIEAAMYLGRQSYIDANRIGIFGWSYGGFMSTNSILKGGEIFSAAVAVAPVTNWKWYDTIYTERYMRTERENKEGYALNSPVNYADRLEGAYLLVHGIGDDNVHFQHSAEMMNALIKANKQFDTYSYPNRNHGIYGDNARLHLYTKMTNFIKENI